MSGKPWISAVLVCISTLALAGPKGTVPRSNSRSYPAHVDQDGAAVGAKLLDVNEVRKTFVSDVNRCCVVVELALYPGKEKPLDVSLNDVVLRVKNPEADAKPSSPKVVAASLQKKARDQHDVTVSPTAEVGIGSGGGYDPVYGSPRGRGVYTTTGVGVGVGIGGGNQSGSSDKDRAAMETELSEKGLPEGQANSPVSGYLYFSLPRNKKATYQLQYVLQGQKILLTLK